MASGRLINRASVDVQYLGNHPEVIPIVASWIYNEWSFLYPGKTRHYVESLLRERLHKKKLPITFVAFKAGDPVGTVSLKEFDLETRRDLTPWITSLYVVRQWRKKGIGATLMKTAQEKASRLGIRKLFLFTADSKLADRFYSRLGWVIRERTTYGSYSVILMEKELD